MATGSHDSQYKYNIFTGRFMVYGIFSKLMTISQSQHVMERELSIMLLRSRERNIPVKQAQWHVLT